MPCLLHAWRSLVLFTSDQRIVSACPLHVPAFLKEKCLAIPCRPSLPSRPRTRQPHLPSPCSPPLFLPFAVQLPPALSSCMALEELDLSNNSRLQLGPADVQDVLCRLPALRTLHLHKDSALCELGGSPWDLRSVQVGNACLSLIWRWLSGCGSAAKRCWVAWKAV